MAKKKSELTEKLEPVVDVAVKAAGATSDVVKAAARKAEPTVKKAEKALKETGRKAASALTPEVYIQWMGQEVSTAQLVEKARADYKANNKGDIRSCKLYIKPEDGMVYYVINKKEGKFPL